MTLSPFPVTATADQWRARDAASVSPCYYRYSDLVVDHALGTHLHTVDGRDVLDFGSGIGVVNLGHRHPAVDAAVRAQLDRVWHTSVTALHPRLVEAAERLVAVAPAGLDQVFFGNSGAEAVEAAIKLARKSTGRSDIIAFRGGFHGRTYGAVSLTASRAGYHAGIGPLLPGIHHVEYGAGVADFDRLFATTVPPGSVAAIIVEPVLGEGGYRVPPADFLPTLRSICDQHGILLIADEVQSGIGRTGRTFALEHTGTRPDILLSAKGLANGLPLSAVVAPAAVMSAWSRGDHGSTFGGNPLACAAAIAVLDTLKSEQIPQRADRLGSVLQERLRALQQRFPVIADVRGLGLMIGVEFADARGPATGLVRQVRAAALRRNLLLLPCGTDDNVIRLAPPLTTPEAELQQGLDILEASLDEVAT